MGERFVNASLMAPLTSATTPIARRTMVCFEDPGSNEYRKFMKFDGGSLTTCLALVETEKQKNHTADDQEQANEVEFPCMCFQRLPLVRIEVEEEE